MRRRRRKQEDFNAEIQAHIEMEAEQLRREGLSEQEAKRRARSAFGNVTNAEERFYERQRYMWLDHLKQDARYALRQFANHLSFSVVVVLTLALGIGATGTIFTLVDRTMIRALPYPDGDRVVHVTDVRQTGRSTAGLVGVPRFFDLQKRAQSFEALGFYYFQQSTLLTAEGKPEPLEGSGTNADFWRAIGVKPLLGRVFKADDDRPNSPLVAVISYRLWQRVFGGDPSIVHQQIKLDGKATTIIGVLSAGMEFPRKAEIWTDARFDPAEWTWRGDGTRWINVIGRVKPGISEAAAANELRVIGANLQKEYPDTDGVWRFGCESLRQFLYGSVRPALLVLMAASGVLLLIACMNVANLLLSRGTARLHEIAMRRALGASQSRILGQLVTEAILLSMAGAVLGLFGSGVALRIFAAQLPSRLGANGSMIDWSVLLLGIVMALVTGVLFGSLPAFAVRRVDLNTVLKQGDVRAGRAMGTKWRLAFIAGQVGLSMILLTGASLLGESLWRLLHAPLGFTPTHVMTFQMELPWTSNRALTERFFTDLQKRIEGLPGVQAVGMISALPTEDWHLRSSFDADWKARTPHGDAINLEDRAVGGDYFQAMQIPLMAGRYFTDADRKAAFPKAIVNQQFVKQYLPVGDPLGHRLINGVTHFEIVGVVGNVRGTSGSLTAVPGPEMYFLGDEGDSKRSFAVRAIGEPGQLASEIREQIHALDPTQTARNVATLDELIGKAVTQPRFNTGLLAAFAVLATVLACIGIYGVVAYSVAQRSVEVGVRIALGATRGQVATVLMNRSLVAALIGMSGGVAVSFAFARLLQSQLFGIEAHHLPAYLIAGATLLLPVLSASLFPALKAAGANPVKALRIT